MTVDEWTKVILVGAIAFAIVLIAIGIFKILNNLADGIYDLRGAIKNIVKLSDMTLEDYTSVRNSLNEILQSFKDLSKGIFEPFKLFNNIIEFVKTLKKEKEEPKELED